MIKQSMILFIQTQKQKIVINESDIDDVFQSIYTTIISSIQKPLGKDSGLIIDSVIDNNISISNHNPSAGSSYINLKKELSQPKKGLTNIQIY